MLSERILKLEPSPTLSLDAKVKEMQKNGIKVINLGLGEPDFSTPNNICEAGIKAIKDGFTHYTPAAGITELRKAISEYLKKQNHISYIPEEIVIGVGSKSLLYNIFQVLCNPGDEVILTTPAWSTYIEQIKLAGAFPVELPLDPPFKTTAEHVSSKITGKTKIILLNSPSNPTGAVINNEELKKIGELAVQKNLWIVSDEIYDRILYSGNHTSVASISEDIKNKTVTVNGFSKSFAMTGWRIGFAAGPKEVIKGIIAFQGQTTSNTSSISQKAAMAALNEDQTSVEKMREEFKKRRNFLAEELDKIKGIEFIIPEGAFYFFASVKNLLNEKYPTSSSWCSGLLEQEKVAVVPGEAFHSPGYFRLSYAANFDDLNKGIEGIKKFCK